VTTRIVIPVISEDKIDTRLSEHFGRAPFFALVELDEECQLTNLTMVPNDSEHFGGTGRPPDRILLLKPQGLITYGMGPRALTIFQNAKVPVLRANATTIKAVITAYCANELQELTQGCQQAHHTH
jgi:predicted Fe-Mo cluster-binding NifX family protein